MVTLSVNVDHAATIRQARKADQPDPVTVAHLAELAGAGGITIHIRTDRRHIQDRDLKLIRQTIKTRLNLEMSLNQEIIRVALEAVPDIVTLVPERPEEVTTEGGLNVSSYIDTISNAINLFNEREIEVSLFVDPDIDQIKSAHKVGAHLVEINTGRYADAPGRSEKEREYRSILDAVKYASKLRLEVAAGHGLDYFNVGPIAAIPGIRELNIGHAIIARSVFVGINKAVGQMLDLMSKGEMLEV